MNADLIEDSPWVRYYDEDSEQHYYYNRTAHQTQYELPEEYTEWKEAEIDKYLKSSTSWRRQMDKKKGKYFYFNKLTSKSQWEVPSEQSDFESFLDQVGQDRAAGDSQYGEEEDYEDTTNQPKSFGEFDDVAVTPTYESEPDPDAEDLPENAEMHRSFSELTEDGDNTDEAAMQEEQRIREMEEAEKKLSRKDGIMEPDVFEAIKKYMTLCDSATPKEIIHKLGQGYVGYAQMTHILCDWIDKATEGSTQSNFDAEEFIADEVAAIIKRKFNKVMRSATTC